MNSLAVTPTVRDLNGGGLNINSGTSSHANLLNAVSDPRRTPLYKTLDDYIISGEQMLFNPT